MSALYLQGISILEIEALLKKIVQEAIIENQSQSEGLNTLTDRKKLLSRTETAKLLGVSLVTLHQWTLQGRITAYRIGSRIRYKANEINSALIEVKSSKNSRKRKS